MYQTGGFIDGGTTVTLLGEGFDGFNGESNNTLAAFGGAVEPVLSLTAGTAVVRSPPFNSSASASGAGRRLEGEALGVSLSISLNGIDFELAAHGIEYRYYEHTTLRLQPSGGPSVGGTAVSVVGEGFDGYDGLASSARCSFGPLVVGVEVLDNDLIGCMSPPAIRRLTATEDASAEQAEKEVAVYAAAQLQASTNLSNGNIGVVVPGVQAEAEDAIADDGEALEMGTNSSDLNTTVSKVEEQYSTEPILQPEVGTRYMWGNGNITSLKDSYPAALRVAINEIDFRGSLVFTYYHQVLASLSCANSTEYGMSVEGGDQSDFAGGSPFGGYPITLIGSGFDGYDGNASTVRVRFVTEAAASSSNATSSSNETNLTTATTTVVETAEVIEVAAVSLQSDRIVVLAPPVELTEGDVTHKRGYPCWNPPCRRTFVTLAINGVDFVGRPEPLVFYFLVDPWRFLGLMERELILGIIVLCGLAIANAMISWQYRFEFYERYLRVKYRIKNRVIYPIMFKD